MTKISIEIVENKQQLNEFLKFSEVIYKKDKYWVEPIINEEANFFSINNPYWAHALSKLFIAKNKKDQIIGRLGVFIDDHYIRHSKEKVAYFGFFESLNNVKIAKELFKEAIKWLKDNSIKILRGPINGTITKETGFLIKGFNMSPEPLMSYNPKYYNNIMKELKFKKKKDLYAYKIDLKKIYPSKAKTNIKITKLNKRKLDEVIESAHFIINETMTESHHFQFVPSSLAEFSYMNREVLHLLDPDLNLFAEKDGRNVGLVIIIPNFNQITKKFHGRLGLLEKLEFFFEKNKINDAKAELICVLPEYAGQGIGTELMNKVLWNLKKKGYKTLDYSWVEEDNIASQKLAMHYGGKHYKTYRVYERKV